jgi:putative membrane protein
VPDMPGMRKVGFTTHNALTLWQWNPFSLVVAAALIVLAYWYLRADWELASRGRRWPGGRTLAFLAGLIVVDAALQSPVATFANSYFQAHVVQHLLLMVAAPLLLALGAPSTLLLQTASRQTKTRWLKILRSRPFMVVSNPAVAWFFYIGVMFVFFLTPLINVAMLHMPLMDVFNLAFLMGGCLYWWPIIDVDPIVHWRMEYGAKMLNVLVGGFPDVLIGLAIISARAPIASMYTLASTHAGGGLLWTSTEFVSLFGCVPILLQWMHSDDRVNARQAAKDSRNASPVATLETLAPEIQTVGAAQHMTAWEEAWLARTGTLPTQDAASGHPAAGNETAGHHRS